MEVNCPGRGSEGSGGAEELMLFGSGSGDSSLSPSSRSVEVGEVTELAGDSDRVGEGDRWLSLLFVVPGLGLSVESPAVAVFVVARCSALDSSSAAMVESPTDAIVGVISRFVCQVSKLKTVNT